MVCFKLNSTQGGVMDKNNKQDEVIKSHVNLIQKQFVDLYNRWQEYMGKPEVKVSSRSQDYINCKPYRDMVNLGKDALPLLIQKMKEGKSNSWKDGQFFLWYAVREISGIDLVKPDEVIVEQEIAERYINWWEKKKS